MTTHREIPDEVADIAWQTFNAEALPIITLRERLNNALTAVAPMLRGDAVPDCWVIRDKDGYKASGWFYERPTDTCADYDRKIPANAPHSIHPLYAAPPTAHGAKELKLSGGRSTSA